MWMMIVQYLNQGQFKYQFLMEKNAISFDVKECRMYELMKERSMNMIVNYFISIAQENIPDDSIIARDLKQRMDEIFGPPWHCCVGRGFGVAVTYKNNHFLFMYIANRAVMVFKH